MCAFDELDGDVPENQLLAAAFRLAEPRTRDINLRNDLRVFGGILSQIWDPPIGDADWFSNRIRYGRRNDRYRSAHELAKLVLEGIALNDRAERGSVTFTSFMVDMNAIFERSVTRLVTKASAGSGVNARAQQTVRAVIIDEETGDTYSTIRPDLIFEDTLTGRTVPVDVKYKLYTNKKMSSADIYQSFVYAYSIDGRSATPRAGLIYPSTSTVSGPALRVKPLVDAQPARIRGAGLDVVAALDAVETSAEAGLYEQVLAMIRELTDLEQHSQSSLTS